MPQWIFWEENISFKDYTERRKTERKKENVSNEHYITGPPQREEILRERKMKRFLNFIKVCHNEFFSLVKHSEFLWTFPKIEWISQNKY